MITSRHPFSQLLQKDLFQTQINGFVESIKTLKTNAELRTLNLSKVFLNFSIHCATQLT